MRKLGFLLKPSPYSSTTSLYSFDGNRGKVDEILREMKENNVKLDSLTVNVFRVYAAESDVRSMEKLLPGCEAITMLQDHESYKKIMRLYSEAGKSEDVYRIWNHIVILRAGEMYYKEYEWSGIQIDVQVPTMLVSGFHKKGMVKQADILMKNTVRNRGCDNKPITPLWKSGRKLGIN
ncbi:hypothetical protein F2Q70_00029899 [Brassica cretica]|nr:hypothetical protein F2Q70_00029899 [Brassica cretica]